MSTLDGTQTSTSGSADHESSKAHSVDYEQLFEQLKHKPCRVDRIDKKYESPGRKPIRTKASIIDRELERVYDATTLEEIHMALEEAGRNLQQLQVFRRLHMLVHEEPLDEPSLVSVLIDLEERNWYKLHAATFVQGNGNETSCELGLGIHNLTGNAERFDVAGEIGSERSNQFSVSHEHPKPYGLPITVNVRISQAILNHQKTSSYTEMFRGVLLGVKSFDGKKGLEYELGWRRLTDTSGVASQAVLSQLDDYVKSAVKYVWNAGQKEVDEETGQLAGWSVRSTSEVSGLGFDRRLQFCKQVVEWQALLPVSSAVSLSLSASAGLILPWVLPTFSGASAAGPAPSGTTLSSCIADRFFLGGPSSLRGFKFKGVGPMAARRPSQTPQVAAAATAPSSTQSQAGPSKPDSLGGDLQASFMAALLFQLPQQALRALRLQGQLFVNGGNCVQLTGRRVPVMEGVQEFSRTFRWSAGAGLVMPTLFGRFEANYVVVLSNQENDRLRRGIQLGFTASPLMNLYHFSLALH
ncbi:hypothetical protein CEUSTIGMA_g4329.t1 [Chlamydomonas eustigma]|uniref:Bacterial surface antigen (D15) domain-containing protein n=1 Tax=Chlamydomonas eustigma TaxID=1157962 RepID=A0A250X1C3_9CHLO|nr:hypothetical protein CEUSTIGMA_g4329.t1 [Chlamydomonas eustigma]|eukprot:GAX76883.1 hypothetical protein CEUSTIGMA_g4329.t1 [Chlamydomonas eustigma]